MSVASGERRAKLRAMTDPVAQPAEQGGPSPDVPERLDAWGPSPGAYAAELREARRGVKPQLMRAMNERVVLEVVRSEGPVSRGELSHLSGLSKPTVAVAITALERDGLVRVAGLRSGARGPATTLYEIRPESGFVLGLDVGREYLRGAIADITGRVHARSARRVTVAAAGHRVAELLGLADSLCEEAAVQRRRVTQVVVGSPGVLDPARGTLVAARNLPGWGRFGVVQELKEALGRSTVVENDIALAALAERDLGHGRGVGTFCFVSVGTGIGMGLVIDGRLHRGARGAAGEIAYFPIGGTARDASPGRVRHHGELESAASASAVVRAARRAGVMGASSARRVFAAAEAGDSRAREIVEDEALLVAKAVASVAAVVDPELVVLGGGIGRAPGFAARVAEALEGIFPFAPRLVVSALGDDAVADGCLALGGEIAWRLLLERS
ncbi:MAG: ROK family transcriptional regulator [Actinomycetota bacterium]|nr:ROK family transcriptional regulator [Actinomycetota bacterium]